VASTARPNPLPQLTAILVSSALLVPPFSVAAQNCGWSRVDHRVAYDASGAWNPSVYRSVVGALTIAEVGGAVWEGAETDISKTS